MIENLFGSKTRYKLLELFMTNPNRSFYVREITRKIGEQINSVRRELSNLLSIGVIISDSSSNRLYYEVNQKFAKYQDLVNLFSHVDVIETQNDTAGKKDKTSKAASKKMSGGKKSQSREKSLGNVSLVVLGGVFTRDRRAPADLFIVGNVTPSSLKSYVDSLESSIEGEIRYLVLSQEDFEYRLSIRDRLTSTMLSGKLVIKVDKNNLLDKGDAD